MYRYIYNMLYICVILCNVYYMKTKLMEYINDISYNKT